MTYTESLAALKSMQNNKAPGSDGLTTEFFKFFWSDLNALLINSFNYGFTKGELSIDQRRGIITLTPKKEKDRYYLKNWRPIALLNTDYKILAKLLAIRLKKVMDNLIDHDQTGYLKGRYIGENIRTVADIMYYLENNNLSGAILQIDFEKAFDSINWAFIQKTLHAFNLGPSFCNWVKILYKNSQSAVINNGYLTQFFCLQRGVRQGCPLSVYLFLLVVELLAVKIRNSDLINGIQLKDKNVKISQMADDTCLFLKDRSSITEALRLLKDFSLVSGLKTNVEKTKAYKVGKATEKLKTDGINLDWENGNMKLLGLTITTNQIDHIKENINPKTELMKILFKVWSQRKLTLIR